MTFTQPVFTNDLMCTSHSVIKPLWSMCPGIPGARGIQEWIQLVWSWVWWAASPGNEQRSEKLWPSGATEVHELGHHGISQPYILFWAYSSCSVNIQWLVKVGIFQSQLRRAESRSWGNFPAQEKTHQPVLWLLQSHHWVF